VDFSSQNESNGGSVPPLHSGPLSYLTSLFNIVGALWTFLLMLLISADVVGRSFFNHPIVGVTEIVTFSIVCIVFLQLGRTVELGRVMRADTFQTAIEKISPRLSLLLAFFAELGGFILVAVIIYGVWPRMMSEYESSYFIGTPGLFTFPSWPVGAAVVAGAGLAGIHFAIRGTRAVLLLFKSSAPKGTAQ
jgi:C4-dicarboxylate transporter, DctM subunit